MDVPIEKIVSRQALRLFPDQPLKCQVLRLSSERGDPMEDEQNRIAPRIYVFITRDLRAYDGFDRQFFKQLAPEGGRGLFSRFHLSTGKFPFEWMKLPGGPLTDQNRAITLDHACHHRGHECHHWITDVQRAPD